MYVRHHIIVSGVIGGIWFYVFRTIPDAMLCFFSGFLIDIDHLFDYYANRSFTLNIKKIHDACRNKELERFYILFHGAELIFLLWGGVFLSGMNRYLMAIAVGVSQHMFFDYLFNPIKPAAYFLSYRISKRFKPQYFTSRSLFNSLMRNGNGTQK